MYCVLVIRIDLNHWYMITYHMILCHMIVLLFIIIFMELMLLLLLFVMFFCFIDKENQNNVFPKKRGMIRLLQQHKQNLNMFSNILMDITKILIIMNNIGDKIEKRMEMEEEEKRTLLLTVIKEMKSTVKL